MNESSIPGDQFGGEVVRGAGLGEAMQAPRFVYEFECIGPDGEVKWRDTIENLVTTEGKKDILDQYFGTGAAGTAPAAIYLGLISADSYTAVAVGDTAAVLPARPAGAPGTARVALMLPPANGPAGRSGCH